MSDVAGPDAVHVIIITRWFATVWSITVDFVRFLTITPQLAALISIK